MSEASEAFGPGYEIAELDAIVASETWQTLEPSHPTDADAWPVDFEVPKIEVLVAAMLEPSIVEPTAEGRQDQALWRDAISEIVIPELGKLARVGFGYSRICYRLTTSQDTVLAVLYGAYSAEEGLHVPADPKLTPVNQDLVRTVYRYSDLRTYLCLPMSDGYNGVILQEYGGESRPQGVSRLLVGASIGIARRRCREYVETIDGAKFVSDTDIDQVERHALFKPGSAKAALIDITVTAPRR